MNFGIIFAGFAAVFPSNLQAVEPLRPMMVPKVETSTPDADFSLVGVISEGAASQKGIAVLRDLRSERSITLRVGDSLPGSPEVRLKSVTRNAAVLEANGKSYHVTTVSGTYASKDYDTDHLGNVGSSSSGNLNTSKEKGLLERWASERSTGVFNSHHLRENTPQVDGDSQEYEYQGEFLDEDEDEFDHYPQAPFREKTVYDATDSSDEGAVRKVPFRTFDHDPELKSLMERGLRGQP